VDSVVTRFITGQDDRTAKKRIEFLKTKLEELDLSKQLQASLDDLQFRGLNLEIKRLGLEMERETLEQKRLMQRNLSALEHERDALKIKVEMASLQRQIKDAQNPAVKQPERSAQDTKQERRENLEKQIELYSLQEDKLKADTQMREDDKRRRLNMISKKKDELYEELEKHL
jgi:hypothetical protein